MSGGPARNAGMEISLVTPDGRKPFYKRVKCHRFERTDGTEERSGIHSKGEAGVRWVKCHRFERTAKVKRWGRNLHMLIIRNLWNFDPLQWQRFFKLHMYTFSNPHVTAGRTDGQSLLNKSHLSATKSLMGHCEMIIKPRKIGDWSLPFLLSLSFDRSIRL